MLNPITHTIAYTAEGILECGIALNDDSFIQKATKTMNSILGKFEADGCIKGTYDENWDSQDSYSCLTGDAQIALIWLKLFELTKNMTYKVNAVKLINFLKTTQNVHLSGKLLKTGGIKGSQPIYGQYEWMSYPSWATKFFIDSLLMLENMKELEKNKHSCECLSPNSQK